MNSDLHNNAIYQNNGHEGKQQEVQVAPLMSQNQFPQNMITLPQYSAQSMGFQHLQSSLQQGTTVTNFPLHHNVVPQTHPVNYQLPQANHGMVSHIQQANHGVVSQIRMNNNIMRTSSNHSPTENMVAYGQMLQTQQQQPMAANTQYKNEPKKGLQRASAMQNSGNVVANSRSQNQSRLAEVPTQRLAQKSIISLPVSKLDEPKSTSNNIPTEANGNVGSTDRQSGQVMNTNTARVNHDQNNVPTANQFQCRKRASYSAACDATLKAQEEAMKLYGNTGRSGCNTPTKRTSPEPASGDAGHKYVKVVGGKPSPSPQESNQSLQDFLLDLLASRGYSNEFYSSLESGYYCKPTDLQKASYGMKLIHAVRSSDDELLTKLLESGISPNPCNNFGESIIHMVCRRGDHKLLKIFLDHGSSVQVSDDFGRTPLHDACWTTSPCFKSVEMLLNKDLRLLHIKDCRGASPLSYVKQENWGAWKEFLDRQKDVWWPHRDVDKEGDEPAPALTQISPHSRPLPNPKGAVSCEEATNIASGKVDIENEKAGAMNKLHNEGLIKMSGSSIVKDNLLVSATQ